MNSVYAATRPRSVTMTLWGVFLLGGWNGGRALALSLNMNISALSTVNITPTPQVRLGMALVWAILFWGAAIALGQRRPFTRTAIPLLLGLHMLNELGLLVIFAQAPSARSSWLINTLFYGIIVVFSVWALNRTAVKSYFS